MTEPDELPDDPELLSETTPAGGSAPADGSGGRVRAELRGLPRWKKFALLVAGVFLLAGLGLSLTGSGDPAPEPGAQSAVSGSGGSAGGGGDTPLVSNFRSGTGSPGTTGGGTTGSGTESTGGGAASPWTPFLIKGGFSFFAGFCIGFALRTFFKVSAAAIGVLLLFLFGLAYLDVIQVDWDAISGYYDSGVDAVKGELGGFKTFIAGSLPSAGLTGFGFFTGFKRG